MRAQARACTDSLFSFKNKEKKREKETKYEEG